MSFLTCAPTTQVRIMVYKMYYSHFKRFDGTMNWKTSHGKMFDLSSRGSNNSDTSSDEYVCVITPSSSFSYEKRFMLSF